MLPDVRVVTPKVDSVVIPVAFAVSYTPTFGFASTIFVICTEPLAYIRTNAGGTGAADPDSRKTAAAEKYVGVVVGEVNVAANDETEVTLLCSAIAVLFVCGQIAPNVENPVPAAGVSVGFDDCAVNPEISAGCADSVDVLPDVTASAEVDPIGF